MSINRDFDRVARQRIEESVAVKQALLGDRDLIRLIVEGGELLASALRSSHKVLLCGNGGSAADAQHIAAELVGRFRHERAGLPALALTVNTSSLTAIGNDYSFESIFAWQLEALGVAGDVAIGISTSGNSPNILRAMDAARGRGLSTLGLTGRSGGKLKARVDRCICVPSDDTPRVQEAHILIGHILCEIVEEKVFVD